MIGLAGRRDHRGATGDGDLGDDCADPASAAIDEQRAAVVDSEQSQRPLGGLSRHAGRPGHTPVDRGRFERPGVEHGEFGLRL